MLQRIDFSKLKRACLRWLDEHRHGVMGTVIFHLVLAICLVSMGISRLENHVEMEIELDMPEPEIVQQQQEEMKKKEEIARQAAVRR